MAKKTIGSGRMERSDQVIGMPPERQRDELEQTCSYALGMVTAFLANGRWKELWNTARASMRERSWTGTMEFLR